MNEYIVINFGEIFLKGKNISFFEKKLLNNLKKSLNKYNQDIFFKKTSGGNFYLKLKSKLQENNILEIENIIANTFGVSSFYRAFFIKTELEELKKIVSKITIESFKKNKEIKTFGICAERLEKSAVLNSKLVNIEIGSVVWKELEKLKVKVSVNLNNPDLKIFIKIKKNFSYVFTKIKKGVGGLPVGSIGKAIVFLSGGIDSPVACYLAQKRGLEVVVIHYHSVPKTTQKSIEKVKNLLKILTKFQNKIKLYLIPIIPIQKNIVNTAKRNLSIILQRRAFIKIGEKIADEEKIQAFITGDSLGQVASQTLENLIAVSEITKKIIIRPLISFDKNDIIDIAKKIETLKISQLPHEDACSVFIPKYPETKAELNLIKKEEKKLDDNLLDIALKNAKIVFIKNENEKNNN